SALLLGMGGPVFAIATSIPLLVIAPAYPQHSTLVLSSVPSTRTSTFHDFGGEVQLVAVGLSEADVQPGTSFPIRLDWRRGEIGRDLSAFVHAVDYTGRVVASTDAALAPDLPLHLWPIDRFVETKLVLLVPPDTSTPQALKIEVGVYAIRNGAVEQLGVT